MSSRDFRILLTFLSTCCLGSLVDGEVKIAPTSNRRIFKPGDVIIGGMFPLHTELIRADDSLTTGPIEDTCSSFFYEGYRLVEAMIFALEEINNDPNFLPQVTLGYDIRDSCGSVAPSAETAVDLVTPMILGEESVKAVVGASRSSVSTAACTVFGMYNIAFMSHGSTSVLLSNKLRYKSFVRTIPSDLSQSRAMSEIILRFGWEWIATIATDDDYGRPGIQQVIDDVEEFGVCVAFSQLLPTHPSEKKVREIVDHLRRDPSIKVIATFIQASGMRLILQEAKRQNITDRIWLACETWSDNSDIARDVYDLVDGTLGIVLSKGEIPGFADYLKTISPFKEKHQNTFLQELWQEAFGCLAPFNENESRSTVTTKIDGRSLSTDITKSSVTTSTISSPGVTPPSVTTSGVTTPGLYATTPGITTSSVSTPNITVPGVTITTKTKPSVSTPGVTVDTNTITTLNQQPSAETTDEKTSNDSNVIASSVEFDPDTTTDTAEDLHTIESSTASSDNLPVCADNHKFDETPAYKASSYRITYNVYLAIRAISQALHNLASCDVQHENTTHCFDIHNFQPWQLLKYIKEVNFTGTDGLHYNLEDNEKGKGRYDINNWQRSGDGEMKLIPIGIFDGGITGNALQINEDLILWNDGSKQVPESVCSRPCPLGTRKVILDGQPPCCFECIPCADGEISNTTGAIYCTACSVGYWSNANNTLCVKKHRDYLRWLEPAGIVVEVLVVCGIAFTLVSTLVYIYHRNTPIIKASNRELSFLMLFFLILCYFGCLAYLGLPTQFLCMIQSLNGIAYTGCVAILFVKTYRLLSIFQARLDSALKRKQLAGIRLQLFMVFIFVVIHAALVTVVLVLAPPVPEQNDAISKTFTYIHCKPTSIGLAIASSLYTWFMSGVCLILAFRARKLPDNFNEAKFITFAMLLYFSVWSIYFPISFWTNGKLKAMSQSVVILVSSTGMLMCIFFPKLYVIMFKPQLNSREAIHRSTMRHAEKQTTRSIELSKSRRIRGVNLASDDVIMRSELVKPPNVQHEDLKVSNSERTISNLDGNRSSTAVVHLDQQIESTT
ncbi:extracellular calcium-sensing receptor-like [Glandiceps talaboti]